jgi:hypothetical protein
MVAVAPVDPKPVRSYELERVGPNVRGYGGRIQQGPAAHLFDTGGAGTRESKGSSGIEPGMPDLVPLYAHTVRQAADGIRDRWQRHEDRFG